MKDACALAVQVRAQIVIAKRTLARGDSIELAFVAPYVPPVVTTPPATQPPADSPPTTKPDTTPTMRPQPPPVSTPPSTPPSSSTIAAHPYAPLPDSAAYAELPRSAVSTVVPAPTRTIAVTSLQAAYDTAKTGDRLKLPPNKAFANPSFNLTSRASWVTI